MPDTLNLPTGLTVVISAGQSRNPEKRKLEEAVAEKAAELAGVSVIRIPHLYDLAQKGETFASLREVESDIVLISWLYDRAAHWVLDRNGIRGQFGDVELKQDLGEDEEDEGEEPSDSEERVTNSQPRPARTIFNLDFRASQNASDFQAEIQRISIAGKLTPEKQTLTLEQLERNANPQNDTFVGATGNTQNAEASDNTLLGVSPIVSIDEHPSRRWYPVIDFSRCTNCMECIDFCLFGVYGVDTLETIVVEQADNCRKGCPACSRVCPQNAIIFPQHKTPAIAGAPVDAGGLKIDLSKLFGAPESDEDAIDVAARERDEQLILAGREAVGDNGLKDRIKSNEQKQTGKKNDDLDGLLDQLDALDL